MKILQINATCGIGSTGIIVRKIQSCCEANGIDSYVAYSIADRPNSEIPKGYRIGNWITAKWAALVSRIIGKQAYVNRFTTWLFIRWLDKINPDIVHLHNLHSNFIHLNMLLHYLARRDVATVITMHDCWYFTGGCTHYTSVGCERWKYGCGNCPSWREIPSYFIDETRRVLADRVKFLSAIPKLTIVGASEWIANEMRKSPLKNLNITHIHNGFDLSIFKPSPSAKRIELGLEDKFIVLGPASKWLLSINSHTFDYFVTNMSDDMVLLLFGCSSIKQDLPENVLQVGYTKNPKEMAELYSLADVMVNCSREDTLSSLNLECQACGTPVVTYDATGSKETVDGRCGFAVSTGDVEALWSKVNKIKEKSKAYYTNQCVNWISTHYEMAENYAKYIELYNLISEN